MRTGSAVWLERARDAERRKESVSFFFCTSLVTSH